jgi:hypothetical protein
MLSRPKPSLRAARVEPAAVVAHEQTPALAMLEHHLDCRRRGVLDGVSDRLARDVHERVERRLAGLGAVRAQRRRRSSTAHAWPPRAQQPRPWRRPAAARVPAGRRPCCERRRGPARRPRRRWLACAACAGSSASMRAVASASDRSCMIRSWTSAAVRRRSCTSSCCAASCSRSAERPRRRSSVAWDEPSPTRLTQGVRRALARLEVFRAAARFAPLAPNSTGATPEPFRCFPPLSIIPCRTSLPWWPGPVAKSTFPGRRLTPARDQSLTCAPAEGAFNPRCDSTLVSHVAGSYSANFPFCKDSLGAILQFARLFGLLDGACFWPAEDRERAGRYARIEAVAVRVGIDLVSEETVRDALSEHGERYLRRIYTEAEVRQCQTPHGLISRPPSRAVRGQGGDDQGAPTGGRADPLAEHRARAPSLRMGRPGAQRPRRRTCGQPGPGRFRC